jgi:1,4-dihydroxy-6-naphthoate synthase
MASTKKVELAISTCPNDTYAFHGLMTRQVDWRGLEFDVRLLDIQQLNDGLFSGEFDVAKASFHAAALLSDSTWVLPSGSALGFGVGPLLLASKPETSPATMADSMTLCPGQHTTATMLFRIFYADAIQSNRATIKQTLFSDIMPQLEQSSADFGVCIHEGRFTWQAQGLSCVEDLGTRWEQETDSPLPLGGILARRELDDETLRDVQAVIRESIEFSNRNPESALPTMRKYAQEFADEVLMQHVELYVNDWTVELGDVGAAALSVLSEKAKESSIVPAGSRPIEIFPAS